LQSDWKRNAVRARDFNDSRSRKRIDVFPIPGFAISEENPRPFSIEQYSEAMASRCEGLKYKNRGSGVTPNGCSLSP
jgi:hypothetical protein